MNLDGKVALVTGACKGIGLQIAHDLAKNGAMVYINGRDEENVKKLVMALCNENLRVRPFICDVSDYDSVKLAFRSYAKEGKKLDILVNNAGILDDALIGMVSLGQIEKTFRTNTYSVLFLSQYASRFMARNNKGSIINISSIIGTNGNEGQAVYGGSKAAVIGITKSLAKELAIKNIRVNAIAPGFIDTDMSRSVSEAVFQERINSIAMKRIGLPSEISNVVGFLASDFSSYVTGQVIGVDGGMLI
jgi:3-oxoacyl-[acyl-carrier protein] reductase